VSYDITFVAKAPVDRTFVLEAATRWADASPNFEVSTTKDGAQLMYDNRNTLVHATFDVSPADADDVPQEDEPEALAGLHPTGCSANFNYLRPAFFAEELVPLAVELAKEIGTVIYDPQDDVVHEPDAFAASGSYARHLQKINASYARDPKHRSSLRQVDSGDLETFWRHNRVRAAVQQSLGNAAFVPTMLLGELKGEPRPTTVFIWGRALPMAFQPSRNVILHREVKSWFKSSSEFRVTQFDAFRQALEEHIRPLDGHPAVMLLQAPEGKLEAAFDRFYATLPTAKDIKDIMPNLVTSLMSVVDAVEP
jgi:hypothetical protein